MNHSQDSSHSTDRPKEYLAFHLGAEQYGIDLLRVQEIRSYDRPTRLVQMPEWVKGVIDLRGRIVPIVDLRIKLGFSEVVYNDFTVVIVLNIGNTMVGAVVDSVADVVALESGRVKPSPQLESQSEHGTAFVEGIADVEGRMLILMDIVALLGRNGLGAEPQEQVLETT